MTDIEVVLTDLGEITTRELVKKHKPYGLDENRKVAKIGGHAAKVAGEAVVTRKNTLNYKYIDDKKLIEDKNSKKKKKLLKIYFYDKILLNYSNNKKI